MALVRQRAGPREDPPMNIIQRLAVVLLAAMSLLGGAAATAHAGPPADNGAVVGWPGSKGDPVS